MSQTLRVLSYFDVPIAGQVVSGGSRTKYAEITVGDPRFDETKLVLRSTTWDAWGFSTEEPVSDFDFLFIVSDLSSVMVELTTDKANAYGTQVYTFPLVANIPFPLAADDSYANYTADFGGGTLSVINRIRVRNLNSGSDANVRVALFT